MASHDSPQAAVGLMWADTRVLGDVSDLLRQLGASQRSDSAVSWVVGKQTQHTSSGIAEGPADDAITLGIWAFAGIHFLRETPEAVEILKTFASDLNKNATLVIAFLCADQQSLKALLGMCARCGLKIKHRLLGSEKDKNSQGPNSDHEDPAGSSLQSKNDTRKGDEGGLSAGVVDQVRSLTCSLGEALESQNVESAGIKIASLLKLLQGHREQVGKHGACVLT